MLGDKLEKQIESIDEKVSGIHKHIINLNKDQDKFEEKDDLLEMIKPFGSIRERSVAMEEERPLFLNIEFFKQFEKGYSELKEELCKGEREMLEKIAKERESATTTEAKEEEISQE